MTTWWEDAKAGCAIQAACAILGIGKVGRGYGPCPACGAKFRGREDRRGPLNISEGWHCHACGEGGSVLDLVGWHLLGGRKPVIGENGAVMREWFAREGFCSPAHGNAASPTPQPRRHAPPPPPPPEPLPPWDVLLFWSALGPVGACEHSSEFVRRRGLEPGIIEDRDLARVLDESVRLPWWADHVHRMVGVPAVVVPMYDCCGTMASLVFRRVGRGKRKSVSARGCRAGLVFADGEALEMLSDRAPRTIVVTEGEMDYLTWATRFSDVADCIPAVVGVVSGSWTGQLAASIPAGSRVVVRTHHDEPGHEYAKRITESLGPWVQTARCGEDMDDNDLLLAGRLPTNPME